MTRFSSFSSATTTTTAMNPQHEQLSQDSSCTPPTIIQMDDIFQLLQEADHAYEKCCCCDYHHYHHHHHPNNKKEHQHHQRQAIATKYYDAVYLMRQYIVQLQQQTRKNNSNFDDKSQSHSIQVLLQDKIRHYEQLAATIVTNNSNSSCYHNTNNNHNNNSGSMTMIEQRNPTNTVPRCNTNKNHSTTRTTPYSCATATTKATTTTSTKATAAVATTEIEQEANTLFQQAFEMERDQHKEQQQQHSTDIILTKYMSAAECYLQLLGQQQRITSSSSINKSLVQKRLQLTLDRIEALKKQQQLQLSTSSSSSAAKAPTTTTPITTAVKKEMEILQQSSAMISGLIVPPWSDTDAHQFNAAACRKESTLYTDPNGFLSLSLQQRQHFYTWARPSEIVRIRRQQISSTPLFSSFFTKKKNHGRVAATTTTNDVSSIVMFSTLDDKNSILVSPNTIQQRYGNNSSSFISSLCCVANIIKNQNNNNNNNNGNPQCLSSLLTSMIYPQGPNTKLPFYNATSGQYMVRLHYNGIPRCVIVDDYLPIDKYGNLLCSYSISPTSTDRFELWVPIIEKAYMKLMGGYNNDNVIHKSNTNRSSSSSGSIDLYTLTGWIPEQIHFPITTTATLCNKDNHLIESKSQVSSTTGNPVTVASAISTNSNNIDNSNLYEFDEIWERIFVAMNSTRNTCLMTVTSKTSSNTDVIHSNGNKTTLQQVGLLPGRAYSVLSVKKTSNGIRLLQLKNPWNHQCTWQGQYSSFNELDGNPTFLKEIGYSDPTTISKLNKLDGIFWICWEDVLQYFTHFNVVWNPSAFQYQSTMHGQWLQQQQMGPIDDTYNVGENPQYFVTLSDRAIQTNATIWILLSRHSSTFVVGNEDNNHLTLNIHRQSAKKEHIWYPGQRGNCVLSGTYSNTPHVLIRYTVHGRNDKNLALVLSQVNKCIDWNYTLTCYCTEDFVVHPPQNDLKYHTQVSSTWTTYTAGGPKGYDTYNKNPQYTITIRKTTEIQICLTSTTTMIAIHASLVPVRSSHHDDPMQLLLLGPSIVDTGQYCPNFVVSDRTIVPPGSYILLISNDQVGQTGFYTVKVLSNERSIQLKKNLGTTTT